MASVKGPLEEYGIRGEGFTWLENQKHQGTKTQHQVKADGPSGSHIEIRIVSPLEEAAARKSIADEWNSLKNLYSAPQTPYMGDIAQAIGGCPTTFGPRQVNLQILGQKVSALLGATSSDRAFGACTKEAARLRGAFFGYYDQNSKALWTWRVTAPWPAKTKLSDDWLPSITSRFKK
jgi:hypothetical protein